MHKIKVAHYQKFILCLTVVILGDIICVLLERAGIISISTEDFLAGTIAGWFITTLMRKENRPQLLDPDL